MTNENSSTTPNGGKTPYYKDYRVQVGGILVACLSLYFGYQFFTRNIESTNNATLQCEIIDITSQVNGVIDGIHFTDDEMVAQDVNLVSIEQNDYQAEVGRYDAALQAAKLDYENEKLQLDILEIQLVKEIQNASLNMSNAESKLSSFKHEIDSLRNELKGLNHELEFYRENHENEKKLRKDGLISEVDYKNTKTLFNLKDAEVSSLESRISRIELLKNAEQSVVERARNRLAELNATKEMQIRRQYVKSELAASYIQSAQSELDKARIDLERTRIIAKRSGQITNRRVSAGDYVEIGQPIASIVSCNHESWVRANFKETQVEKMKIGDRVMFTVDTYPGVEFEGQVEGISSGSGSTFSVIPPENATGNFTKVVKRIPVKIRITDDRDYIMRIGSSAYVTVYFNENKPIQLANKLTKVQR